MRKVAKGIAFAASASFVAGCTSTQVGPIRPITIADDVAYTRPLAEPDLSAFYGAPLATQAAVRNQIVTARMYIADVEYHYYEARLTREVQEEGLAATLTSLGLTTASTLVGASATKTVLSGTATAVIGADKAYNEKELLSNTIQALQTQMRADRKTEAAVIYAKMYKDAANNTKVITPISEYTLPMALSDAETYYQAGTIASALIGLSKTVANAEQNADQAKSQAGPNPAAVSDAKGTAAPISDSSVPMVFGAGISGGNFGGNAAGTSRKQSTRNNANILLVDPQKACQQLATKTSTQIAICNFIANGTTNTSNAAEALKAVQQRNSLKSVGLAEVISSKDLETERAMLVGDLQPLMTPSSR